MFKYSIFFKKNCREETIYPGLKNPHERIYMQLLYLTFLHGDGSQRLSMFTNAAVAPRGHVTARNDPGEFPHHPVGLRPDPRALSGPVISFEPPTRRWLTGAIYVHECRGGAQRPGDRQKRSGGGPRTTLWGKGPTPGPYLAP